MALRTLMGLALLEFAITPRVVFAASSATVVRDRSIDPILRSFARRDPEQRVRAVVRLDVATASAALIGLADRGITTALDRDGAPVHVGRYHVVEGTAAALLAAARDGAHVRLDRPTVEPTTADEATISAVAARGPVPMQGPRGAGMKILDFERGLDIRHPHFFEADGGAHPWVDLDGDGVLTPGVDGLDTDLDGTIADDERLQLLDYALSWQTQGGWDNTGLDGLLQPDVDYLYIDFDGNTKRDYGPDYAESTPGYGEPLLLPDDADGDGTITIDERVILLSTPKIAAYRRDGVTYRRGENLNEVGFQDSFRTGHGTAVLGSLVGGQDRLFRRHRGIVPDVEVLLFEKQTSDTEIYADGFAWGIDEGAQVFLHEYSSWSREQLDGSGEHDVLIDEATAEGVVNVCPAGNLANANKHASAIADADPVEFAFHVPQDVVTNSFSLDLHWRDPDVVLQCSATTPSGEVVPLVEGEPVASTVELETMRWQSERGTSLLLIEAMDTPQGSLVGAWSVSCTHDAPGTAVHAYLDDDNSGWGIGVAFDEPDDNATLCTPATADTCIAVAAYVHENPYEDGAGELARYSSRGPRIDGGKTIDVAAPADPTTPYPSIDDPDFGLVPYLWQNNYRSFSGTSGAGPHVAAVAALLLEHEPGLTPAQVRDRLRARARADRHVDGVDGWGGGKLDAYATLYDDRPTTPPPLVDAELTIAFTSSDEGCVASIVVDTMDWSAPSVRWDLDYDGAWDTEFEPGTTREVAVDEDEPELAVRVEYGSAGWRVGGDAVAAIAPSSCFEPPPGADSSSGAGQSSDDGDNDDDETAGTGDDESGTGVLAHDDSGAGCGCAAPSRGPRDAVWLLVLGVAARCFRRREVSGSVP